MVDKKLFVQRLKACMVERYTDENQRKKYFNDMKMKKKVKLPNKVRESFSRDFGLNTNTLGDLLNPQKKYLPDCDTLYSICSFFNVSADYLVGLSDTKEAYEDIYMSDKTGLSPRTIGKIKQYNDGIKQVIDGLVCCKEFDKEQDWLAGLLSSLYDYGLSAYDSTITTKDIFGNETEIKDNDRKRAMLKNPATEIFNFCLDIVPFILKEKRDDIHDLKEQIGDAKIKQLESEIQSSAQK